MQPTDVFPSLVFCASLQQRETLYDVKWYPYPTVDNDQIFAAAGMRDIFVCRPKLNATPSFELLRWFKDEDTETSINSLAWTRDPITGRPLLCVAGRFPKQIKIIDIESGKAIRSIPGHGKGINDLSVSPLSTNLLASASEDYTIRLWNLHPKYERQPCVAMFCGEGHKQPILAIAFHPNGRWLLSGGLDTAVCLWAVPSVADLARTDEELQTHHEPKVIYYPYFHSTEVHHNYVDCVRFYGDLIISKSAQVNVHNEILLWKIEGFHPDDPIPEKVPIPRPGVDTRTAFPHPPRSRGFQRLLTFSIPYTDRFYHRFGLLHTPDMRPMLCMGTQKSKYLFWDLQRLEEGVDVTREGGGRGRGGGKKLKTALSLEGLDHGKDVGMRETPMSSTTSTSGLLDRKYEFANPFEPLKPHRTIVANTNIPKIDGGVKDFATSQLAWSPDGMWLVGVGDLGMICLFHRDAAARNGGA